MRRGQSTLEYVLLIGVVAAGIIAVIVYVSRGHQGNLRSQADQLGAGQYAPGNTNINNSENKTLTSTASVGSSTTVTYGNINEPNTALEAVLKAIVEKWREIYALKQAWELLAVPEAIEGAKAVRDGDFGWTSAGRDLNEKTTELNQAYTYLDVLNNDAKNLTDAWPKRTPDQTSTSSYSREKGTTGTHKDTSENFR